MAPPPKATKRQNIPQSNGNTSIAQNGASDLFGSTPFAVTNHTVNPMMTNPPVTQSTTGPNYNLSDFNTQTSIFPPNVPLNGAFSNGAPGMVGFDPFDTAKFNINGGNFNTISNGFSNPMGNGFNNGLSNGFGNTSPFGDKQNGSIMLDSNFSGFLDKRISEMKVIFFQKTSSIFIVLIIQKILYFIGWI